MTKSRIAKLTKSVRGTQVVTPAGVGTATGAGVQDGQVWIFVTVEGAGFNGSTLKTAVLAN